MPATLEQYDGQVQYRVMLVPIAGMAGDALERCARAVAEAMPDFEIANTGSEVEFKAYEGTTLKARIEVTKKGIAMETSCHVDKPCVPWAKWNAWLLALATMATSALSWKPVDMMLVALVCDLLIKPKPCNNYQWTIAHLLPSTELSALIGQREVVDFDIRLKLGVSEEAGKAFYLLIDSNQTEREIAAKDYSNSHTRIVVGCHHALTDVRRTDYATTDADLVAVITKQESELRGWIEKDVLPGVVKLQEAARTGG